VNAYSPVRVSYNAITKNGHTPHNTSLSLFHLFSIFGRLAQQKATPFKTFMKESEINTAKALAFRQGSSFARHWHGVLGSWLFLFNHWAVLSQLYSEIR